MPGTPVQKRRPPPTISFSISAPGVCPGPAAQPRGPRSAIIPDPGPERRQHQDQEPAGSFLGGQDAGEGAHATIIQVVLQRLPPFPLWAQLWGARAGWWASTTPEAGPEFCGVVHPGPRSDVCRPHLVPRADPSGPVALGCLCDPPGSAAAVTAPLLCSLENSTNSADTASNKFVFGQNMSERVLVSAPCGRRSSWARDGLELPRSKGHVGRGCRAAPVNSGRSQLHVRQRRPSWASA